MRHTSRADSVLSREASVLVIDDEENLRHMLAVLLDKEGYQVTVAANGLEGLEYVQNNEFEFVLCDIRMPVMDGTTFLQRLVETGIDTTVIMMSAYGTVDSALQCMKLGAYDYVSKPFKKDEVLLTLKKAAERERLKRENRRLHREVAREYSFQNIVSISSKMHALFSMVRKVCDHKTTVLISGESGTGKELIARAIHYNGVRRRAPFVALNCAALPEGLLESELFGHLKGAFTDAVSTKTGLFVEANHGTLFLDEVADMPAALQVKLLRVLQESEIRPVGSPVTRRVDVRVISATAKDLAGEVAAGRFREDLYYRLNVFVMEIPPLRERLEDLPGLVQHFIAKYGKAYGKAARQAAPEVIRTLLDYSWPGNIRELENCIERAVVLTEGDILSLQSLPKAMLNVGQSDGSVDESAGSLSIKKAEERLEREYIAKALVVTGGNRTHAARLLEISHRALLYKLKEFGME